MVKYLSKILYVLPAKINSLILLIFSFILVSSLEAFGLGVIGPFMGLATQPDIIYEIPLLNFLYEKFSFQQERDFVATVGCLIIVLFTVKSLVNWSVQVSVFRFSYEQKCELTKKLMKGYLTAPYTFHLRKNSAHIIQNIVNETKAFADRILIPFLNLTSNLIISLCLIGLLVITNITAIVVVLGILLPLFLLFNTFKNNIKEWGRQGSLSNQEIIRYVNHGLGGIKETKVIGCESYFESKVVGQAHRFAQVMNKFYSYRLFPRILIETILIAFLVGLIVISILLGNDVQNLIPTLSVFALVAIRLVPALTNISNGVNVLRNSAHSLDRIYADLKELESVDIYKNHQTLTKSSYNSVKSIDKKHSEKPFHTQSQLELRNEIVLEGIRYRYPEAQTDSLQGISLSIAKGQSIAFIGKSGAGKTTLVDTLLGLLIPQEGDIKVDGQSIYSDGLESWKKMVGYIPQSIFLTDDTIEKNIAFGVSEDLIDSQKIHKAMRDAQLLEVVEQLPNGLKTLVGERGVLLSGGQRQRVGIARALYHDREILVLDEATAALDNETENLVTQAINALQGSKTLILIAHRLSTVEKCNVIYEMERGKIINSGSYENVVLQKKVPNSSS
ncbi:MAG: ABC transporter ATP-binding protein [Cyanobacteria bacterium J06592_8]